MKNYKILFVILFLSLIFTNVVFGQASASWVRTYNGAGNGSDVAKAMAVDNQGNVCVTGYSNGGSTGYDYATIKYSPNGDIIWSRIYNGAGNGSDVPNALAIDGSGNVYVTGYSKIGAFDCDYATIKYGSNGDLIWVRTYNGPANANDYSVALAVDGSQNVYVTGYIGAGSSIDYATIKYDSNGDMVWIKTYNGAGNSSDVAKAMSIDNSGNVYVTGSTFSFSIYRDYATIKYNSNGDLIWARTYNGAENGDDYPNALTVDNTGNVYVAGDNGENTSNIDYTIIKYNSNGDVVWIRTYNGAGNGMDAATALAVDNLGNVYVTGYSYISGYDYATLKYNSNGDFIWLRTFDYEGSPDYAVALKLDNLGNVFVTGRSYSGGSYNYTTVKYKSDGTQLWTISYNGTGNGEDSPTALALDNSGNFYVTGNSSNGSDFDYATIKYTQTPYYITSSAVGDGTISPSGIITMYWGLDTTFTITSNLGNHIDSVVVDGVNQGAISNYTFFSVINHHTITAYFGINTYTITATAIGNGTISPSGTVIVNYGSDTTFYIAPNPGYHLDSLIMDGINHGADSTSFRFEDISDNHAIDAYFSINYYNLTVNIIGNGSVVKNPDTTAYVYGTWVILTANAGKAGSPRFGSDEAGWHFMGWSDSLTGSNNPDSILINNEKVVTATFAIDTFTITSSVVGNGTIDPLGLINVIYGSNQLYTFSANTGYHLDSLLVDDINHGDDSTEYQFSGISANHTIKVYFSINTYTITATAYGSGVIAPPGVTVVNYGGNQSYAITPNPGHHIDSIVVDGLNVGTASPYDFTNVIASHTIDAYFSINTYTITASASTGGVIIPSGVIVVNYGDDTTFTITPDLNYHLDSLLIDGINHGADSTEYQFIDIIASHTIDAYFSINTYTLDISIVGNGSVEKNPDLLIYEHGTNVELTAVPDSGWAFMRWSDDAFGMINPLYVTMDGNKNITATFEQGGWYILSPMPTNNTPKLVKDGGAIVAATPLTEDGGAIYSFKGWKSAMFYKFDGDTWTAMESIPVGLKYKPTKPIDSLKFNKKGPGKGASLCWDGDNTIYAIKGNGLWEFWAYDIALDSWMPRQWIGGDKGAKAGSAIAYADGKVYMLLSKQKLTGFFFVYDVGTDAWSELTSPTLGPNNKKWKDGTDLIAYGTNTLVALKGGDKYCPFWSYDIATGIWTEIESIPLVHPMLNKKVKIGDGGSITTDGSVVYAIKGGGKQDFWMYSPIMDAGVWTPIDTVPQGPLLKKGMPKTGAGLAYLDSYVYLLKGNKTDEFWRFVPYPAGITNLTPSVIATTNSEITNNLHFSLTANTFSRTINYTVPTAAKVTIKLYNATGQMMQTILAEYLNAGNYTLNLNACILAKGVYFLKYEANNVKSELKLIIQ
jgi:uncharacterized delta-60 repeat protein